MAAVGHGRQPKPGRGARLVWEELTSSCTGQTKLDGDAMSHVQLTHPLYRFAWLPMVVGLAGAIALAVQHLEVEPFPLPRIMAPLFLGFGLFKAGLAISLMIILRQGGEQSEALQAEHNGRRGVIGWISYKLAAALTALAAGFWAASV